MLPFLRRFVPAAILTAFIATALVAAERRTWTDSTGKHQVLAELIAVEGDAVRLRNAEGKEITLPLKRLSGADRAFVRRQARDGEPTEAGASPEADELAERAERFFADLRTKERGEALAMLTAEARKLADKSPLFGLPKPDSHAKAIRVGETEIKATDAKTPVTVRVGKERVKTALHWILESHDDGDDAWRVAAISAQLPGGERTIEFDKPVAEKKVDPLLALMNKPMPVEGLTLDGDRFSSQAFAGKVVLVDFWATWCGPCRAEMPNILANYKEHHDAGFEVIAISQDKNLETLGEFIADQQPPWVVLADRNPKVKRPMGGRYGIRYLPSLVLVGRDGKVAAVNCRGKKLGPAIKKALRAPAGSELAQR